MIKLKDIKYRIGTTGKNRNGDDYATCLAYIDARTAMDELDSLYKDNWQFSWKRVDNTAWAVKGQLKVLTESGWRVHSDVGYPQNMKTKEDSDSTEWLKDAVSDSLKRCAVHVGIGRFLYDAPLLYTEEVDVNSSGKVYRLNKTGKQIVEGNIEKWYTEIEK